MGKNEIVIYYDNCTIASLSDLLTDKNTDFFLIVFCGHGYASSNGDTILELQPDEEYKVSKIKALLKNKKTLLIADCCRKTCPLFYVSEEMKLRLFSTNKRYQNTYFRDKCRATYMENISKLSVGYFVEGYACSINECSHENEDGGYYSNSLINETYIIMKQKIKKKQPFIIYFADVHDNIINTVNTLSEKEYRETQTPHRVKGEQMPFLVVP